jgi:hypothetical protein
LPRNDHRTPATSEFRRALLVVALGALALAGCHSSTKKRGEPLPRSGPAHSMRVALDAELGDESIKRALAGKFRLVRRSADRVVIRRPGLTVVFRRMDPYAALQAFRRGELDEAPVPQGEIRALEAHPTLSPALRARALQGIDVVVLPRGLSPAMRRVYRLTVPRGEYQALISERVAPPAYGLRLDAEPTSPADARAARASIRGLSPSPLTLGVADRPELVEAAELVWAEWRQLGLPIRLQPGARAAHMRFVRAIPSSSITARPDDVVPLGWVAEARLVSPRVHGWRMDELGVVDYSRVSLEAGP